MIVLLLLPAVLLPRVDPKKFKTLYMGATNYACATSTKSPFRYRSGTARRVQPRPRRPGC